MSKPSEIPLNTNYHVFKANIKPMWEDPANKQGGKWTVTVNDRSQIDRCWENLVREHNLEFSEHVFVAQNICACSCLP